MEKNSFFFLDLNGLEDHEQTEIKLHLDSYEILANVTFPWSSDLSDANISRASSLNVHSPAFKPLMAPSLYPASHLDFPADTSNLAYHPPCVYGMNNVSVTVPLQVTDYSMGSHLKQQNIIEQSNLNCNAEHFIPRANITNPYSSSLLQAQVLVHNAPVNMMNCVPTYQKVPFPPECSLPANTSVNNAVPTSDPQNILPFRNQSFNNIHCCLNDSINSISVSKTKVETLSSNKSTSFQNSTEHHNNLSHPQRLAPQTEQLKNTVELEHELGINVPLEPIVDTHHHQHLKANSDNLNQAVDDEFHSVETSLSQVVLEKVDSNPTNSDSPVLSKSEEVKASDTQDHGLKQDTVAQIPVTRSFADVVKSKKDNKGVISIIPTLKPVTKQNGSVNDASPRDSEKLRFEEDRMSLELGRYLYEVKNDFTPIGLQPRGLINRRTWCYINATLQALLACSPFYTLLRNLPIGPEVDRGTSCTPIIDSMVSLVYNFVKSSETITVEDLQIGSAFQPDVIYKMLGIFKSHCLKGLQEDAEEFLSFILNGMHEEMVAVLKYYENKFNLNKNDGVKQNGHVGASDDEEEWQVIGVKQRGMVTRNVAEHPTPISNLLGGQIKSFLTSSTNKTSASVQPFFTLQLDIQSDIVSSVEDALSQLTVKEPILGYTCPKTQQEVEAYSHVMLQKLPSILILHLKRFVYNTTGGCKKVMKYAEYPLLLELKKELFSPEAKKMKKSSSYKLFAVLYHDGPKAVQGHYISDIYHNTGKTWVRCDDSSICPITEAQVLTHSPPRVPYLLFYQATKPTNAN